MELLPVNSGANVSNMAKKNAAAMAMVRRRMKVIPPERRSAIARNAASKRWEGHKAKRPASSRKKATVA